jgi:hypothetical protein
MPSCLVRVCSSGACCMLQVMRTYERRLLTLVRCTLQWRMLQAADCASHVACSMLQVVCCMLHVACCTLHVARCTLHVACCTLHAACFALRVACCTLHVARCMLHVACCMLHVARCTFHVACCMLRVALPGVRTRRGEPRVLVPLGVLPDVVRVHAERAVALQTNANATCGRTTRRQLDATRAAQPVVTHARPSVHRSQRRWLRLDATCRAARSMAPGAAAQRIRRNRAGPGADVGV